ncbi:MULTISPECIES: MerR family transcriptional regulator [unclassified Marinobacterium]|jgi:DNA-binding transcriptional MerR regulator|uniref:MerR family transcriptional regulator n=1 Tax=unclassified Marinobacterium TaxID=2644139 RepID=UPI0015689914|nr:MULTISPECIES: MerR family transcriptional regulator [unclassified Marinobacterium]NRP37428.1 HTH-type transcriptional regulator ZntR [Marinobacterium sp. xm-a-121]NRP58370.1 HTH-type transcriptional regulator ZntR [Marinobacterium sp. xm-d-510]NRP98519.1 HTH-type transcriptional regulator ZntR [Marinobacterium sp. xm-a-127]NRP99772.1 HTH-type transcriptional regulator ZntR [Marinobacterium sp. xm-v-233]
MQVNEVAKLLSITPDTVRFYTRSGLLKPQINPDNGYKHFSPSDINRLKFILAARSLGFSIDDVREIFARTDHQHSACGLVRDIINQRLEETEARFRDMVALRNRMIAAAKTWNEMEDQCPTNESICHLIETFTEDEAHEQH